MSETKKLLAILGSNKNIRQILERAGELGMPNWYLGAGAVAQVAWNHLHNFPPEHGIKDYDLIYFDPADTSYEGEDIFIKKADKLFKGLAMPVDVKNQARVHLWHEEHFGFSIKPYASAEEAIASWPAIATSVGVRKNPDGRYEICAPFGLGDIFSMIVRPNKTQIKKPIYEAKTARWSKIWPKLKITPWNYENSI